MYFFLVGINYISDFFIKDRWYFNNKTYALIIGGTFVLDILGIYLFYFLLPDFWFFPG